MRALILILTILSLASCSKEEPIIEEEFYNGTASAMINGESFDLNPRMHPSRGGNDSTYSLHIDYLIGNNVLRKSIYFRYVKKIDLIQSLSRVDGNNRKDPQCGHATRIYDGDVMGNYYYLNETDEIEDYLHLTSFDEATGKVTGKFQASFVVDTFTKSDPGSPDTIVITDGYFETTIFK